MARDRERWIAFVNPRYLPMVRVSELIYLYYSFQPLSLSVAYASLTFVPYYMLPVADSSEPMQLHNPICPVLRERVL